jgi:hypothetical protein
MMTSEAEAVAKLVARTTARLDELLAEYAELYNLAYESDTVTSGEREFAKSSMISIWNEIHRMPSANKTDD